MPKTDCTLPVMMLLLVGKARAQAVSDKADTAVDEAGIGHIGGAAIAGNGSGREVDEGAAGAKVDTLRNGAGIGDAVAPAVSRKMPVLKPPPPPPLIWP